MLAAYQKMDELVRRTYKLIVYASMSILVDTTDQEACRRNGQAQSAAAQAVAALAFIDPELIAIGEETLDQWLVKEAGLTDYAHYVDNLFRQQAHVRSAEVEELLGLVSDPFDNVFNTLNMLSNSDFNFAPAVASDGSQVQVTASTFDNLMGEPDRELRRTAYESYTDIYLRFQEYPGQQPGYQYQVAGFPRCAPAITSLCLEASLFDDNIPVEVFHNLIDTYKRNLPTWHRYWASPAQSLGVIELYPYDIWAPLTKNTAQIDL